MGLWQNFENSRDDDDDIPYVQVPSNLYELYHNENDENICVVCRIAPRTHALVPCGHRVLCEECLPQLQQQRCPLCTLAFTQTLRIW